MNKDAKINHQEIAGVIIRPPFLFLGAFLVALILKHIVVWPISADGDASMFQAGGLLLLLGVLLLGTCAAFFARSDTPIQTSQPSRALVRNGPFRFSRNPIYIALFILYIGLILLINSWWGILFLPLLYLIMTYGVIMREEVYLEKKFGQEYLDYKRQVRRWF